MKTIGILVNSIGYGGNERSAVNIAKSISKEYNVIMIIQEDCGNHYGYDGVVIDLHTPCAQSTLGKIANSVRRIIRLKKIINKYNIDTLFIILPVSNPINYLQYSCKKIVSCRDCGDLIKNTNKYIKMTEKSDVIVCNSKYQQEILVKRAPYIREKTITIYNIVDLDKIEQQKNQPINETVKEFIDGHRYFVSVGRLAQAKGLNNLLKSFSLICKKEDIRLLLIGDGELRTKITTLISDLGISDYVMLLGFDDNPFKYISRSDAFVLSSFYEGFPNTLVEAMACGAVVVATDCPSGPAEILCGSAQNENVITKYGILIKGLREDESTWDSNDIKPEHEAFANALESVLSDSALSNNLKKNAQERISDFSTLKIISDWKSIL